MSWSKTTDGEILNLDKVQYVGVRELEEPEEPNTHCVLAVIDEEVKHMLIIGSEQACNNYLNAIFNKLHKVP